MWEKELEAAIDTGLKAKNIVMDIYNKPFDVEIKEDNSPVTVADKCSDRFIRDHLKCLFPNYGFLTEESFDNLTRLDNDYVWIIDPVDGTKDFIAKDNEFCINIALCYKHKVVVGVVVVPAYDEIYYASEGNGSYYQKVGEKPVKIHVNDKTSNLTALISVFHNTEEENEILARNRARIGTILHKGSALKPCMIARGLAELTIRTSPRTKEWDTAAPQIIVEEAGGLFLDRRGRRMEYNRKDVFNRDGYIVANREENLLK